MSSCPNCGDGMIQGRLSDGSFAPKHYCPSCETIAETEDDSV